MTMFTLQDLAEIIATRRDADAAVSYTRSLMDGGLAGCVQKLGEEAVETVIAALSDDKVLIENESADLLYHLLVVLHMKDVSIDHVLAVLERRTKQSGHAEKAGRG